MFAFQYHHIHDLQTLKMVHFFLAHLVYRCNML